MEQLLSRKALLNAVLAVLVAGWTLGDAETAEAGGMYAGTGVYVNGQQLSWADVYALKQIYGVVYRGSYWMTSNGTWGRMGGPAQGNLYLDVRRRQYAGNTQYRSPANRWNTGGQWSGTLSSGTVGPTPQSSVYSVGGRVLTLP